MNKKFQIDMRDIPRSQFCQRWSSVNCPPQNLAAHHYIVAMCVNKLCSDIFGKDLTDTMRLKLLQYALWHDTPEILTTDIASPYKKRIAQICTQKKMPNPLDIIDDQIAPFLTKMKKELSKHPSFLIVKLADLIDAYIYISMEGRGAHAKSVVKEVHNAFIAKVDDAKKKHPKYDWDKAIELLELMSDSEGNKLAFEDI